MFVYNANSGLGNALLDSIHKILDPNTYNCNLCAITFGFFSEHKKWKEFRKGSGLEMEFLHLDEFKKRYPNEKQDRESFPQVFILKEGKLQVFLRKGEINDMKSQEDLILAIRAKLS
ncbi:MULTISPECIES: GTPase [Arenibacter]|uniref:GTPase n=1 Tax=Arenibacter TaxID=178469 RepID=UPI001E2F8001|nr:MULTISPECIES: GTPase [Arenibacter]